MPSWISACVAATCAAFAVSGLLGAETEELLRTIKAVGGKGEGHAEAVLAVRQLSQSDAATLLTILKGMDRANPLAENWLRGAFEAVADRALKQGWGFPVRELEAFLRDRAQSPRARRLAYEWLLKADPDAADRIIPTMLDDPSVEMRRDAVALVIVAARQLADAGAQADAVRSYRDALTAAADGDQVRDIAAALQQLGEEVDLVRHFGLVTEWHVIGPFDNADRAGWATAYPPEREVQLNAEYDGKLGKVGWAQLRTESLAGELDINKVGLFDIAKLTTLHPDAVSYAATEFVSDRDRSVEFRISTPNAWKLWVNGELLFGQEEYHRGRKFDQYIVRGRLKARQNMLLLKLCQNEQQEDWAQVWAFQFRVCDPASRAVHSAARRTAVR